MAHDPTDVLAQEAAREDAQQRNKRASDRDIEDIKWLMSSKRGRRIVRGFLERAGVWRSSWSTNALTMAFAEGRRNEGLALLATINENCPERYTQMIEERKEHE